MSEYKSYKRKGQIEARPWTNDDASALAKGPIHISVSAADRMAAYMQPAIGMVARNPDNHDDQWYIAPDYFAKHYESA